jgi:hypothetical protein
MIKYTNSKLLDLISIKTLLERNDKSSESSNEIYTKDIELFNTKFFSPNNIKYIDIDFYFQTKNKHNLFNTIMTNTIICFKLDDIVSGPFLLSLLYAFTTIHSKSNIIKPSTSINTYYYIGSGLSDIKQSRLDSLKKFYESNLNNISPNYYLVKISEEFVEKIKNIISKIIINKLVHMARLKFINHNESFINYYNMILKQTNKLHKIQHEWLTMNNLN